MPTLTITIDAAGQTAGRVKTISAAHLTRFLDAYRALLGQIQDGVDGEGNPVMRDMTDAETVEAWADGLVAGTRANVKRQEQVSAAQTASDTVTEIGFA